jgi:pimeloyl-ACP methyl ester carboxylesterase
LHGGLSAVLVVLVLALPAALAADEPPKEPPPPEEFSLRTSDGKTIVATFYASPKGKDAAAVILVHGHGGNRADFGNLALKLQAAGCAVIAPDLRGHGASTGGLNELLPTDYADMVRRDLETVKGFLLGRNNAGELNIERLGIVGVEMGSTLAVNWAALDWSWPMLATGKQGQDVKAVAVVSPEWSYRGVRITEAMAQPAVQSQLAFLIVTGGRNAKLSAEAKRLYSALARHHAETTAIEKQTLFLHQPATSLQGTQLMQEKSLDVEQMIVDFMVLRLIKPAYPWRSRKNPLQ